MESVITFFCIFVTYIVLFIRESFININLIECNDEIMSEKKIF